MHLVFGYSVGPYFNQKLHVADFWYYTGYESPRDCHIQNVPAIHYTDICMCFLRCLLRGKISIYITFVTHSYSSASKSTTTISESPLRALISSEIYHVVERTASSVEPEHGKETPAAFQNASNQTSVAFDTVPTCRHATLSTAYGDTDSITSYLLATQTPENTITPFWYCYRSLEPNVSSFGYATCPLLWHYQNVENVKS